MPRHTGGLSAAVQPRTRLPGALAGNQQQTQFGGITGTFSGPAQGDLLRSGVTTGAGTTASPITGGITGGVDRLRGGIFPDEGTAGPQPPLPPGATPGSTGTTDGPKNPFTGEGMPGGIPTAFKPGTPQDEIDRAMARHQQFSDTQNAAGGERQVDPGETAARSKLADLMANRPSSREGNTQAQLDWASKVGLANQELVKFTGGAGAEMQRAGIPIPQLGKPGTERQVAQADRERRLESGELPPDVFDRITDPGARGGGGGGGAGGGGGGGAGGGGGIGIPRQGELSEALQEAQTAQITAQTGDIGAGRAESGRRLGLEEELGRGELGLGGRRVGLEEELGRGGLTLAQDRFGLKRDLVNRFFPQEPDARIPEFGDGQFPGGGGGGGEQDELERQLRERALRETTPESIANDPRAGVNRLAGQRQSERSRARLAAQGAASGVNPLQSGDFQAELNKLDLARAADESAFESGIFGEQEQERGRARESALELGEARKQRKLARELARNQERSSLIASL